MIDSRLYLEFVKAALFEEYINGLFSCPPLNVLYVVPSSCFQNIVHEMMSVLVNFIKNNFQRIEYLIFRPNVTRLSAGPLPKHRDVTCWTVPLLLSFTSPIYRSILILLLHWSTPTYGHAHYVHRSFTSVCAALATQTETGVLM